YSLAEKWTPSRRLLMFFAGLEDYLILQKAAEIDPVKTREIARKVIDAFDFNGNTMGAAHYAAREQLLELIQDGN
ncbi:MAG: hypothetical protein J6Y80_02205, partial [Victivallales bacterium]|nr:hypothetical protein [Victivallales bacterium]